MITRLEVLQKRGKMHGLRLSSVLGGLLTE